MAVATHTNDRVAPSRDRVGDHLTMLPQADLSSHALNSRADNVAFQAAQPRNDMAELSQRHGFASNEQLLAGAHADVAAPRADAADPRGVPGGASKPDAPPAAADTHASASKPDAATPQATEVGGSHDTYDVRVASTIGNDTKVAVDVAPTTVTSDAPTTSTTSPVDTVDARPAAPVEHAQAQPQHDAPPQSYAQNEQPRFAPRTDLG